MYGAALPERCSLLYGVLSLVFSEQVLEAAADNGPGSATAYISSVLTRTVQFHGDAPDTSARLMSNGEYDLQDGTLSFMAHVCGDFVGAKAGGAVAAMMDVGGTEGGCLTLVHDGNTIWLPTQLVLGPCLADGALFNAHVKP